MMPAVPRRLVLGAAFCLGLLAAPAWADAPPADGCRVAFDVGSSGIRAGATGSAAVPRADIDYLAPLMAGRSLDDTVPATVAALSATSGLPAQAGFDPGCRRVAGGFSAWRLALSRDPAALAATLATIRAKSGVPLLVIPQTVEGAYGYFAARQALGEALTTSHVLDIGGGSLQIAGAHTSFGDNLGQKVWHRQLCQVIRRTSDAPCVLQPLAPEQLAAVRNWLGEKLRPAAQALGGSVTLTAISRPVTRGVLPALERLQGGAGKKDEAAAGSTLGTLSLASLSTAIDRLAGLTLAETANRVGSQPRYAAYLLSDMLLVEGLLRATGGTTLKVAELDLTNLPGLLADDRAYAWGERYGCYLERLGRQGLAAYASDPATCPAEAPPPRP